jgi:dipeptidase E
MPTPRLILAGGGDAPDSHPLDALFAGWIGPGGRLLYLPVATGNPAGYRDDLVWVSAIFRPLGVGAIEMWTTLAGRDAGHLTNFDGIYIGGGNTFHLLDLLRRTGFDRLLRDFVAAGGAVYGGSAGAIILGRDIGPAAHIDSNTAGVRNTHGLDLLGGYAVWCHYVADADDARIRAYVAATGFPVLALTERAGLRVEGPRILVAGYDPCVRYTAAGAHEVAVGDEG